MADLKLTIGNLPQAANAIDNQEIPVNTGGATQKITVAQLKSLIQDQIFISNDIFVGMGFWHTGSYLTSTQSNYFLPADGRYLYNIDTHYPALYNFLNNTNNKYTGDKNQQISAYNAELALSIAETGIESPIQDGSNGKYCLFIENDGSYTCRMPTVLDHVKSLDSRTAKLIAATGGVGTGAQNIGTAIPSKLPVLKSNISNIEVSNLNYEGFGESGYAPNPLLQLSPSSGSQYNQAPVYGPTGIITNASFNTSSAYVTSETDPTLASVKFPNYLSNIERIMDYNEVRSVIYQFVIYVGIKRV